MKDFPVEQFAKLQYFSVQGNSIQMYAEGQTITLNFDSEGELFSFLRSWAVYDRQKTAGGAAPPLPNQLLAPYSRRGACA